MGKTRYHRILRTKDHSSLVRVIGRNIVILNIYYNPGKLNWLVTALSGPLVTSLLVTFLESILYWILYRHLENSGHKVTWHSAKKSRDDRIIETRYTDWSFSTIYAIVLFAAQFGLFCMFVLDLNQDDDTHNPCKVHFVQWGISVAVTMIAGGGEAGSAFDKNVWTQINAEAKKRSENEKASQGPVLMSHIYLRMTFDYIINCLCRNAILGLAPVMLSVDTRMNFIKDCLAVFFICKLDDLNDAKSVKSAFEQWDYDYNLWQNQDDEANLLEDAITNDEAPVPQAARTCRVPCNVM